MRETTAGYGVLIDTKDGCNRLALDGNGGRFFHYSRKKAVEFKKELAKHLHRKLKVVPMSVTYEVNL